MTNKKIEEETRETEEIRERLERDIRELESMYDYDDLEKKVEIGEKKAVGISEEDWDNMDIDEKNRLRQENLDFMKQYEENSIYGRQKTKKVKIMDTFGGIILFIVVYMLAKYAS